MSINNQKFIILLVAVVGIVILMVSNTVESAVGMPILSGVVLYAIGNGVGARTGSNTSLIYRSEDDPTIVKSSAVIKPTVIRVEPADVETPSNV